MARLKKDGTPDRRGGKKPGSGRKRKIARLSNYDKAIKLLDDSIEDALKVIIRGTKSKNEKHAMHCADILLRKALPDRVDLKNEYKKEAAKVHKDMSKLTDEELNYIIHGK